MEAGRNVGDHQTGIFHFAAQAAHCRVGGVHLEPRNVSEPEFDTVVSRFFDQFEPPLKTPTLWDHIVADGFFHGTSFVLDARFQTKMFSYPQNRKYGYRSQVIGTGIDDKSGAPVSAPRHLTLVARKSKEMMRNKAQGISDVFLPPNTFSCFNC